MCFPLFHNQIHQLIESMVLFQSLFFTKSLYLLFVRMSLPLYPSIENEIPNQSIDFSEQGVQYTVYQMNA